MKLSSSLPIVTFALSTAACSGATGTSIPEPPGAGSGSTPGTPTGAPAATSPAASPAFPGGPRPSGEGNVVIHVRASTRAVPHTDGLSGQTPREEYVGIRALLLGTSKDDPDPLVVFDHQGYVEARLADGDDTIVARVPASSLRAGRYTWARTVVTHARYRVDATVHASGFSMPGEYENLVVLSDGTDVGGKKRMSGDVVSTFRGAGRVYGPTAATMPIGAWSSGGIALEVANGRAAYVYPVNVVVDPSTKRQVDVLFDVNMHECFRWQDTPGPGYARHVWDVELGSWEPVMQFGANSFSLAYVTR